MAFERLRRLGPCQGRANLDGFADVRRRFNALITPGDVLAAVSLGHMTGLGGLVENIRPALEEHARTELITRGQVNLGEAGRLANQQP